MKASLFTLLTFGGFFASTIANPVATSSSVEKRQDEEYDELNASLTTLFEKIQEQTAIINETVQAAPEGISEQQANATAESLAPQFQAITDLLSAETTKLVKRSFSATRGAHTKADLFATVSIIIWELLFTVKSIVFKLGLGSVLIYATPLVLGLVDLLKALDKVVAGLLYAVKEVADELLKAVGLGLLGVIPPP
ncbi:hypothetical protein F4809DRAFT_641113 [Biscogniauxia mediterranea]|nr:hypothetical protein F4809DRAFT_641113 [Biscogniauxia mediterranea]